MKYCKYIKISKDRKKDNSSDAINEDLYKIDLISLDGSVSEVSGLVLLDLINYIKEMENLYKSSFFKLVSSNIVCFSSRKVENEIMHHIIDKLEINDSESVSGDYDDESDWCLSVEKKPDNKYQLYMHSPVVGNSGIILVDEKQKELVVDTFIKTHGLSNYSLGMLIEKGRVEYSEDSKNDPVIKKIIVSPSYSSINVQYEDGSSKSVDIEEFPSLVSKIAKEYNNADDAFSQMYNEGKVDFKFSKNVNSYGKKIYSAKIKSNGDVILKTKKWLPLRKKINITKNPQDVFEAITSMCYSNKKDYKDLVGDCITFVTVKNKKTKEHLPKQIIFGKELDTSVEPASVNYKYYAVYKDGYKEITKKEAVDNFNKLARKKKVSKDSIDKMFSKEYCKVLCVEDIKDYVSNKNKIHIFDKFKRKNKEQKSSNREKVGIFGKLGRFVKTTCKKLFGTPFKKLVALTTTVVIACGGIVTGLISKKSKEIKTKSSYSDSTDLLQGYTNSSVDVPNVDNYASFNNDLSISNNSYNELLNRCVQNKNRKDSMQMVGSYLEKYNAKAFIHSNNVHNFDEVFYEYLAYNMSIGSKFNDILGKYNLDIDEFRKVMSEAIFKDSIVHSVQTDTIDKHIIIESSEGQALYKKYENLFIEMNKEENILKQSDYARQFYDMVRVDLPQMSQNSYENVPGYMYIIEEFRLAMDSSPLQTDNCFTEDEVNYISGILDNVIVKRLEKANASNQAGYFVDEYYKNGIVDLCPTINEFKNASVLENKKNIIESDSSISYGNNGAIDNNNILQSNNGFSSKQEVASEILVQPNNSNGYYNNSDEYSSYNYSSNNDYSSPFEVVGNNSNLADVTDSIVDGSISVDVECQIIDHYGDAKSIVNGTLSPEDMAIVEYGVVDSFYDEISTNTVDNFTSSEVEFNNSSYNEGVVDEEVVEDYSEVVLSPSDLDIYNPSDPLPDPNAIYNSSDKMSYEQIADLTVELMTVPINDDSNDKVYHL